MKKIIIKISIGCILASALLGILWVLKVIKIDGIIGKILLTVLTTGIASLISLNSINLLEEKINIWAIISLSLLCLSSILAIIQFWAWFSWGLYSQLTIVISVFSVLFNFIVSCMIKLGFSRLPYQITTYSLIAIFDILLTITIFKDNFLQGVVVKIFVIDIILALVGMAILSIFSKKSIRSIDTDKDFVKISKIEYNTLKERISFLENELQKQIELNKKD